MPKRDLFLIPIYLSFDYQHEYFKAVDFTVTRQTRLTSFRISIVFPRERGDLFCLDASCRKVSEGIHTGQKFSHARETSRRETKKGLTKVLSAMGNNLYHAGIKPGDP